MSKVYITGHRNPDMDSICAAAAYAVLKNMTDPANEYIAVRCGNLNENVEAILESLNLTAPPFLPDVYPKVEDVMMTGEKGVQAADTLSEMAATYEDSQPSATPVYDGDTFRGILSVDDISSWVLHEISQKGGISQIPTIGDLLREQAEPVSPKDRFEDVKRRLAPSKLRGIAVMDESGYVGYVTRRCFLKTPKHNVILVDHNEPKQSIKGVETANILEIIDHHRIDAVKTELPVFIDAEPVGSTCTIIYQLFLRHQKPIPPTAARFLLAGILSDTLILKSPTTTSVDMAAAEYLATLCETTTEKYGMTMFRNVRELTNRDPKEAISSDFKTYSQKNVQVGIAQIEVTTMPRLQDYEEAYLKALEEVRSENGLNWALLMITDILHEQSVLLATRSSLNQYLNYSALSEHAYDMPRVMSRKKQLLPDVLYAIEQGR